MEERVVSMEMMLIRSWPDYCVCFANEFVLDKTKVKIINAGETGRETVIIVLFRRSFYYPVCLHV